MDVNGPTAEEIFKLMFSIKRVDYFDVVDAVCTTRFVFAMTDK